jgi:hypothetical protein
VARPEKIVFEVPAAVGVGPAANVLRFRDKTVQVTGPFEGSLELEGSIGGDNYQTLGAAITAPGLVAVPYTLEFLRVRVTALTSGTPKVVAAGFDYRAM